MFGWLKRKSEKAPTPQAPQLKPTQKPEPRVGGDIAILGLENWWFSTFSDEDREWIAGAYAPMGGRRRPLVEGGPYLPKPDAFRHLSAVAPWLSKPGHEHCAIAFLHKALEYEADDMEVLDRHFALYNISETFYRWRDTVPGALEGAIKASERSISFHEETAKAMIAWSGIMAKHPGFDRLRIIAEKRGDYAKALDLCLTAQAAGWVDDWPKHIDRIKKRAAKAGQPLE